MESTSKTYQYFKVIEGIPRYGKVEIELNFNTDKSTVKGECAQKMPDGSSDVPEIWKLSAIEAANSILTHYVLPSPIQITIKAIAGTYVDTKPSHIGAAVTIGIFDLCGSPLSAEDIQSVHKFVSTNNLFDAIPKYAELRLTKPSKSEIL